MDCTEFMFLAGHGPDHAASPGPVAFGRFPGRTGKRHAGRCRAHDAAGPGRVDTDTLNSADTGWMMTATALVLLMTLPGIALFYGGMVRRKSVLNVMACVVATCAIVSLLWFAVGYSIAFTPGSGALGPVIGGTERL